MSGLRAFSVVLPALVLALVHCGDDGDGLPVDDAGTASASSGGSGTSGTPLPADAASDADAGAEPPEVVADRKAEPGYVTGVESFTPGTCAGFNASAMPGVVFGAPRGTGTLSGSTDVLSLGTGGEIVLAFAPLSIVDEPGPDFVVFENVFYANGNPERAYQELAEVSVSADGQSWRTYPCGGDAGSAQCAGRTPVLSAPGNGVAANDPQVAGGDAFDLADLDVTSVRFVRIRDIGSQRCMGEGGPGANGFDLDAVAVVHGALGS